MKSAEYKGASNRIGGQTKQSLNIGDEQDYFIRFRVNFKDGNSKKYTIDPKLKADPEGILGNPK